MNKAQIEYTVIIPTLNSGAQIDALLSALESQTIQPKKIIIIDSESDDDTRLYMDSHHLVDLHIIERSKFNHGGTRNYGVSLSNTPFFVMMTQDALPMDEYCMEMLLTPFDDELVAAVCGRQIAYQKSSNFEKQVRNYRYPDESRIWSKKDIPNMGFQAYLISDVCAAYRRTAFDSVNGFRQPLMTNEDMLIAADLLETGFKLAYSAFARVWHSHDYTFIQEFARNRTVGRFMKEYGNRFGNEIGEGIGLFKAVVYQLVREGCWIDLIPFCINCAARISGNWAGKHDH